MRRRLSMFDRSLIGPAVLDSLRKRDPRVQWRKPRFLVTEAGLGYRLRAD